MGEWVVLVSLSIPSIRADTEPISLVSHLHALHVRDALLQPRELLAPRRPREELQLVFERARLLSSLRRLGCVV